MVRTLTQHIGDPDTNPPSPHQAERELVPQSPTIQVSALTIGLKVIREGLLLLPPLTVLCGVRQPLRPPTVSGTAGKIGTPPPIFPTGSWIRMKLRWETDILMPRGRQPGT